MELLTQKVVLHVSILIKGLNNMNLLLQFNVYLHVEA